MMLLTEEKLNSKKGRIFNIERCSTEDGPGIRTTVFLKGCALRCEWCANPESQKFRREILFKSVVCEGCDRCRQNCPEKAIRLDSKFGEITNMNKCSLCMQCIDQCYVNARIVQGVDYTVEELMLILEKDALYYEKSGGGITFSGGEPLLQADFLMNCAKKIHEKGWSVLIETCGEAPKENLIKVAPLCDIIYCDFKHYDSEEHRKLTGRGNKLILENIEWLDTYFEGELSLRYPFIPGRNDSEEAIKRFLIYAENLKSVREVVFLPFHRLGLDKYNGLGREYLMGEMESLKVKDLDFLKEYEGQFNLSIKIQ